MMDFVTLISAATQAAALYEKVRKGLESHNGTLTPDQYREVKAKLDSTHAEMLQISARIDDLTAPAARG